MILLPAIDIIDGNPVRLYQGDYGKVEKVAESILDTATSFAHAGASWIHMVDLDGAKSGKPVNQQAIIEVAKTVKANVEVGGGIRTMEDIDTYLSNGVSRVILGTAAVNDEQLLKTALEKYGEKIAVGIDARDRKVKTAGWLSNSDLDFVEFARKMESYGVKNVIVTDISKDGTLTGPNFQMYEELKNAVNMNLIASGGIHNQSDLEQLSKMQIYGAITGKAIYSGKINLQEALRLEKESC